MELVVDVVARAAGAGAGGIAHTGVPQKVHLIEVQPVIKAVPRQEHEVVDRLRGLVRKQVKYDLIALLHLDIGRVGPVGVYEHWRRAVVLFEAHWLGQLDSRWRAMESCTVRRRRCRC